MGGKTVTGISLHSFRRRQTLALEMPCFLAILR